MFVPHSHATKRSICCANPATVGNSKNLRSGKIDVKASAQTGDNACGEQGVSAEFEEVVVDTDLVELEHFAPDLSDQFFNLRARFDKSLIELAVVLHRAAAGHCGRFFR